MAGKYLSKYRPAFLETATREANGDSTAPAPHRQLQLEEAGCDLWALEENTSFKVI